MNARREKKTFDQTDARRLTDEELSATSAAGAAKRTSTRGTAFPTETVSMVYGSIEWTY